MPRDHLWPAHPHPFPDELLSSWIVRIAHANAIKLQTLSWQLFGNERSPWNRDIDRSAPPWLLRTLCAHTGCNYWDAFHATLVIYRGRLYPRRRTSGRLSWVLPIKGHGMRRTASSLQFCPACLAGNPIPYFRKTWRLALYTYCPEHQCALYDECPACHSPVTPHRGDFGRELIEARPMHACATCGIDLRHVPCYPVTFPCESLRTLSEAMLRSIMPAANTAHRFDLGFFRVLHHLCGMICSKSNNGLLLRYLTTTLGHTEVPLLPEGRIGIEDLRRDARHLVLMYGLWLVEDLEQRLTEAWQDKAIRYNLMLKGFTRPPRWYGDIVQSLSNWRSIKH
ncbi:MAG TPA: hypothetical protein DCL53_08515 [Thauera sp.]|nr:hypothetical protein [Thauera sp.]